MKISFDSTSTRFGFSFKVIGSRGRFDTISDCEFLDNSRIVCADRQMAQLYLIEFDCSNNTHTVLDSVTGICDGVPQHFDLISLYQTGSISTIYSSMYTNKLFSCNVIDNKFCNLQAKLVKEKEAYHGVFAYDASSVYVTNMKTPAITEFNTVTNEARTFVCAEGGRMKDVVSLNPEYLLAISSSNGPIDGAVDADGAVTPVGPSYNSKLLIYKRDTFELVNSHFLGGSHVDSCIYRAPFCYVTYTDMSGQGFILRSKISEGYNFTEITFIPCAGFPHGLATYGDKFAYTSYEETALYIHTITDEGDILME
jgi:hypothetical protein